MTERVLIAAQDDASAALAAARAQSGFSAEEWAVAEELLKTPGTYLAHCVLREVGGSYYMARLLEGSPPRSKSRFSPMLDAIAGGDSISMYDNREDIRREHPQLPAKTAFCVGDRRWMVIRIVWWREHLLMAGPVR